MGVGQSRREDDRHGQRHEVRGFKIIIDSETGRWKRTCVICHSDIEHTVLAPPFPLYDSWRDVRSGCISMIYGMFIPLVSRVKLKSRERLS